MKILSFAILLFLGACETKTKIDINYTPEESPQQCCTTVYLGKMTITGYQPKESQTDSTPCEPANGKLVHSDGIAVSRDLHVRWGGPLKFKDLVWIEGEGAKIVNDIMADEQCIQWQNSECIKTKKIRNQIDVLVWTQEEEALFWKKWKGKKVRVWLMTTQKD